MPFFFVRGEVGDIIRRAAIHDVSIRRLQESVGVQPAVDRHRADEADVRAFRRLDGADAAIVAVVHVAYFQFRALPAQPAGAEGGEAALVRQLGQRVGLVHELRELRGAEERLDRRGDRLGADHRLRRNALRVEAGHALANDALHAQQAQAELVLQQLADAAHALVHQVVDLVDRGRRVIGVQAQQVGEDRQDVVLRQRGGRLRHRQAQFLVHHVAADARQVVAARVAEDAGQALAGELGGHRVAGTVAAVDVDECLVFVVGRVLLQRRFDERAHLGDDHARQRQRADTAGGLALDAAALLGEQFAGVRVDDLFPGALAHHLVAGGRLQHRGGAEEGEQTRGRRWCGSPRCPARC